MSDYLFDKEGEPDPEIERLEGLLAPMAYRGAPPALPRPRRRAPVYIVAAAGLALAAALAAVLIAHPWRPRPSSWIDTGEVAVRLDVGVGTVELLPHTRARVVASEATRHELALERGTLKATIHAPPRQFVVRTPRAVVTDLGCAFEVSVDATGRGRVVVTEGRVGVASDGAPEVVVPAGARVELSEHGPGAPSLPAPPTTPAPPATPAPRPHHAPKKSAAHPAKKPTMAPLTKPQPKTTAPQPKQEPPRLQHDSLKDLKNSVE